MRVKTKREAFIKRYNNRQQQQQQRKQKEQNGNQNNNNNNDDDDCNTANLTNLQDVCSKQVQEFTN